MSRFSIRIQVFVLGMAFVLLLVVGGALSWRMQSGVVRDVAYANEVFRQNATVALIREDMEQARANGLEMAKGRKGAFESMLGNFGEVIEAVETDVHHFADPEDPRAARPKYVEILQRIGDGTSALRDVLRELPREGNLQLMPPTQRSLEEIDATLMQHIDRLDAMQEMLRTEVHETEVETLDSLEHAMTALLAAIAGVTTLSIAMVVGFGRILSRPLMRSAQSVRNIIAGDYTAPVPGVGRGDEVGEIARGLANLRDGLVAAEAADAETQRVGERRVALFDRLGQAMTSLSNGKLDERLDPDKWQDLGETYRQLCVDFNHLAENISGMVASLRDSANMVQRNSRELSSMSNEMSRRSEVQAATLEQSAAALEELSSSVTAAADRAEEADQRVGEGRRRAEEGGEVMSKALEAMSSIAASSDQITQIIGVIDDIAFQTNLLALNAGVEAARAGESGKGFSVVASEVRSLAQRASESAREIKALVSNSSQQVKEGGLLVEQTGATLSDIVRHVTEVSEMVAEIASGAKEQSAGLQEINVGVSELDKVTQQNAAMVGETSSASHQLQGEADRLTEQLNRFTGEAAPELEDITPVAAPVEAFAGPDLAEAPAQLPRPMATAVGSDTNWEDF
ncbi:methyl-accepting chemotaxis protein [Salipiger mucosus]|uniref:Methyl-accepting chemotaxis protein McpC n=1 Tax=Salipiger mucosus DSM 16094 TaxID=1123237 RepID=S9QZG3_9RHOB|nr:methyl-accepting chemotaxis protein [Salipiger mucosus]EPX86771.1 methyl-accepting chemotaxis protein McpC [Salipiger mucosus DSM 16094]